MRRFTNPLLEEISGACYLKALCFEVAPNNFIYLVRFKFLFLTTYFFTDTTGNYIVRPSISKTLDRKKKSSTLYHFCKDKREENIWKVFPECNLAKIVTTGVALVRSADPRNGIEIEKHCHN